LVLVPTMPAVLVELPVSPIVSVPVPSIAWPEPAKFVMTKHPLEFVQLLLSGRGIAPASRETASKANASPIAMQ
jgi:hypothetical protein